jgi:hypothetical protein
MNNWSYSRYSTWKKCPALLKYQMETTERAPTPPAAQRGLDFHKAAELFILGETNELPELLEYYRGFFVSLRENDAAPELQLAVDETWNPLAFDDPSRWWRGILDCVVEQPDKIIVFDWKTGQEYDDHRDQREIYAAVYHANNDKDVPIQVMHVYFDKKLNSMSEYRPDDIPKIRKQWEGNVEKMFSDTRMAPNPGWHCRSCRFSRFQGGPCQF